MSITLRPDQLQVLDATRQELRAGHRRVLMQAPTGFGKTVVASAMFGGAAQRGLRSVFIVHRRELVAQADRAFTENDVPHGIIASGIMPDLDQLVQIATIGALARRRDELRDVRFVAWDECHHLPAPGWSALQDALSGAFHVGLSATPRRLDGQGLRDHFDTIVKGPPQRWLQKRGRLATCRHYSPRSIDLTGVRIRLGDYHRGDLTAAVDRSLVDDDIVANYRRFAHGKRMLVFATGIEHSIRAVTVLNTAGIPAEHVDGKTPTVERDAAIGRFERGETMVLSNVDLFGEGFDLPALEAVMMLRATMSISLYLQMIGRALRPAVGKNHAIVIDLVGNGARHGLVDDDRDWSLDAPATEPDPPRGLSVCAACALLDRHRTFCSACGAPPKPNRRDDMELWRDLVADPGLSIRLRSMRRQELLSWADDERKLRIVALALNFKPGWAWHRFQERQRGVA